MTVTTSGQSRSHPRLVSVSSFPERRRPLRQADTAATPAAGDLPGVEDSMEAQWVVYASPACPEIICISLAGVGREKSDCSSARMENGDRRRKRGMTRATRHDRLVGPTAARPRRW